MPDPNVQVMDDLHDKLLSAFEREEIRDASPELRTNTIRRRVRRPWLIALAAASVVIAASALALVSTSGTGPLTTQAALAEVARAALNSAEAQPNQFTYSKFVTHTYSSYPGLMVSSAISDADRKKIFPGPPFSAIVDRTRETWISLDKPGFVSNHQASVTYPTSLDQARAKSFLNAKQKKLTARHASWHSDFGAGTGSYVIPDDSFDPRRSETYGFEAEKRYLIADQRLTRKEVLHFPTDPDAILRHLKARGKIYSDPSEALWPVLTGQFTPGYGVPLPAKLQAAFVRAIGKLPGVQLLGERELPGGAKGLAFAHTFNGMREELVFGRKTGTLLSSQLSVASHEQRSFSGVGVPIYASLPVGTVVGGFTLVEQRVADRLPAAVVENLKTNTKPKHR